MYTLVNFEVRNNPDLGDVGMPILGTDGVPLVLEISGLGANYCFLLPVQVFNFEYFRLVFGATQGDQRSIYFNLAG